MSNVEPEDEQEANKSGAVPSDSNTQHPADDGRLTSNTPSSHSRRDFLRRATRQVAKEAVEIGTKVVPGGALMRQFVESGDPKPDDIDDDPLAIREKPAPVLLKNPLDWFAAWRKGRGGSDE